MAENIMQCLGGNTVLSVKQRYILLLMTLLLAMLTGCISAPKVAGSETGKEGKPGWVVQGSVTLNTHASRIFHGIGTASAKGDITQATSSADNLARAELSRIVASYFEICARNYIASGKADQSQFTQQNLSKFITDFTRQNLKTVYIADHWHDAQADVIYSVAELNLQQVKEMLADSKQMHKGFKNYLQVNADLIFDQNATRTE